MNALRRKGVDARLLVFWPQKWRPDEYDINLDLPRQGLLRQQAVQWRALAKYLPQTDVFHFYFGKTLVPKSVNLPILRATRKKSVMHFLGDDIRGKRPEELEYRKKFDACIVGSYAATRWVPDPTAVVPPGLDLRDYEPVPPVERERPLVVHAPSDPEKKGTRHVIDACSRLPVDLDVVHGVPHDEAVERFKRADIVVDQLHYLWHGVFAIESMAYGKPVVTHLDPDAVRQTEEAFGLKVPIVAATKDDLVEKLTPLVESFELRKQLGLGGPCLRRAGSRSRQGRRPLHRDLRLGARVMLQRLKELLRHSAIYGVGSIIARVLGVLLLPLYTRYLSPSDYGLIETLVALAAVLTALVAQGMKSAFFRFYFDSAELERRLSWSAPRSGTSWPRRRSSRWRGSSLRRRSPGCSSERTITGIWSSPPSSASGPR